MNGSNNNNDKVNEKIDEAIGSLKSLVDELEASYWVPLLRTPFNGLNELLEGMKSDGTPLEQPFKSFVSNLESAKNLLEFPYLLLAPLLLEGTDMGHRIVKNKMQSKAGDLKFAVDDDVDFASQVMETVLRGSKRHLAGRPEILNRLMHQASLLAWSAYENFCKDVFIYSLNRRPDLYGVILKNQNLKERFSISQAAWPNVLERAGYDLIGKLGTIIGSDKDFSSPQLLKDLFPVLFSEFHGNENFFTIIQSRDLWVLGNRRHLIAHRCGVVDADYMKKCDDSTQKIGQLLTLRGRDIAQSLGAVAAAAMCLYGVARVCWMTPPEG
ncbi:MULTISPECIES: hypothetical protein [unclassified Burkholderia]|uniref:hypothetical protein n=1 Tax=unclassified Burkholderia TaxID=2613784 RepID=UPI0011781161|nr:MULTISPECIES: hypothetical protein [unclassified Burkholderia]MBR8234269.1 hypothetical protein [Burkholderia sp. AU32357]